MTPDPRAMTDSTASLMLLDNLDDEVAVADAEAALEADDLVPVPQEALPNDLLL